MIGQEYTKLKDDLLEDKCLCCNKNYWQKFDEKLKEQFFNIYKFSNHYNNKFILMCWGGVFPYVYMIIVKNSMKNYYLKKRLFMVT